MTGNIPHDATSGITDRFFQMSSNPLGVIDSSGYFVQVSPSFAQLLGVSGNDLPTSRFIEFVHPDDRAPTQAHIDALAAGGTSVAVENRYRCVTGAYRSFRWNLEADQDAALLYLEGHDLSEQQQVDLELRIGEQRARLATEAAEMYAWEVDLAHETFDWNETPRHPVDIPMPQTLDQAWEVVHADDRRWTKEMIEHAIATRGSFTIEYRLAHRQSHDEQWLSTVGMAVATTDGAPDRLLGVTHDITERKRRELNATFLTELSDELNRLISPEDIMQTTGEMLSHHFGSSHITFATVNESTDEIRAVYDRRATEPDSVVGAHRLSVYVNENERVLQELRAGRPVVINDVWADSRTFAQDESFSQNRVAPQLMVSHVRDGHLDFVIVIQHATPNAWRDDEIELLQEIAARCYPRLERAYAETELRDNRAELQRQAQFLDAMISAVGDFVCVLDRDRRFVYANGSLRSYWGMTNEEFIGKSLGALGYPPELEQLFDQQIAHIIETGESVSGEVPYTSPSGVAGWYDYKFSPIFDTDGGVTQVAGISQNSTERRRRDEQLRISEERLRLATTAADMYAWEVDLDTGSLQTTVSEDLLADFPMPKTVEEVWAFVHPEDVDRYRSAFNHAVDTSGEFELEYRLLNPTSGHMQWVYSAAVAIPGNIFAPHRMVGITQHIAARKGAEADLRESEQRYRLLFDSINEGFCIIELAFNDDGSTRDYRIAMVNPAFARHTGVENASGRWMREIAPDLESTWFEVFGEVATSGEPVQLVGQARTLGGRWFNVNAFPIENRGQNLVGILFTDITNSREAEEERRAREEQKAFLLELGDSLRTQTNIRGIETTATRLLGEKIEADQVLYAAIDESSNDVIPRYEWSRDGVVSATGEHVLSAFGPELNRDILAGATIVVTDILDDGRTNQRSALYDELGIKSFVAFPLVRNGELITSITVHNGTPRQWTDWDVLLVQEVAERTRDLVERVRSQSQQERARQDAEAAVRARDMFLSIASHELRNPVASIKGSAQFLRRSFRKGRLDEERGERFTTTMVESADRLALLLDDLLNVSRLQAGQLRVHPQSVNLTELVRESFQEARFGTGLHQALVDIAEGDAVVLDRERIRQIIANLLDNAIKYSPEGGEVHVRLSYEDDGALLRVQDQGIGLPDGALESVFEPFGRAANAAASNIPGMGLGLYISRMIAEAHGGNLWAESDGDGQGTTMCLWLPRRLPE